METEGQSARMSRDIEKLKRDFEDLEVRSMSHNIVIYNVPEQAREDIDKTVTDCFTKMLKLPDHPILSERHPVAPVQVDIAHRVGKVNQRNRPIVVKLMRRKGKDIILQHARNLRGTGISISEQLPSEMRERRTLQIPKLKALRGQHRNDTSTKVVLSKDKLRLNNTVVPSDFETNPISLEKSESWMFFEYDSIRHSEPIEFSGSCFQGHMAKITSMDEVKRAYCALLQNPKTASAHHIMYAYSYTDETATFNQQFVQHGNSDDGEYGGSQILTRLLSETKLNNIFLAVSRVHNGPNIGRKRYELIEESCRRVISI